MTQREYTLVEMIRNPRVLICEAIDMTRDGHFYLYRYNGTEGKFYRATVPSGAASIHFQLLKPSDKIPLGGWKVVVKGKLYKKSLHLVNKKKLQKARTGSGDPNGKTLRNKQLRPYPGSE